MSEWKVVRLGDVAPFKYGKSKVAKERLTGEHKVFSSSGHCGYSDETLANNGIIVGRKGSVGTVYYSEQPFFAIDTAFYIDEVDKNSDINFIYYYLKTLKLEQYNNDAAVPGLNRNLAHGLKITIPNLIPQEKIANVLSTYDKLIENNNRRIEVLEQTAEEIYKEWFVRMRFPGYENTKFDKGIPEDWKVKRIEELARFKRGKNLVIADAIQGEVPVIAGGIEPSCYHNESNTKAPVITVSASGANAGYTQLNYVDVWASDCSYIDKRETELIYYMYLLLKVSHKEILNLQLGSAQPHVYARDLNRFKFLEPTQDLILKMNNIAEKIFNQIKYLTIKNQNLIKQRDLLLPRLMNGTIQVK